MATLNDGHTEMNILQLKIDRFPISFLFLMMVSILLGLKKNIKST